MDKNINKIKRLKHQSYYRGCKETDIILGLFARAQLDELSAEQVEIYSDLLDENDWDIYAWAQHKKPFDAKYDEIISMIREFHGIK